MSYSHLTITDRIKIETYLELGLKPCQLQVNLASISLPFQESYGRQNGYSAALAQEEYDHRAKQKGRKSRLTPKLKKEIENGLKRSEIVKLLVTGSLILWCLPEAKARGVWLLFWSEKRAFT